MGLPINPLVAMFLELMIAATAFTGMLGGVATYIGLKAFKWARDRSLIFAATGFTFITAGTVLGGLGCVFSNYDEVAIHFVQSAMVGAGLFSIVYSISRAGQLAKPR